VWSPSAAAIPLPSETAERRADHAERAPFLLRVSQQIAAEKRASWRARSLVVLISCIAAVACALPITGLRVLNPFNVSWITGDTATEYLAWSFFRQETRLTLPFGWSSAMGHPLGLSTAYLDPMPLLQTLFWMAGGLLPDNFQYFGLYFLLCLVLQFYFGYRIGCLALNGDKLAGVLGGGFFLTAPPFIWRAVGHFSLVSHWLILAALHQFLQAIRRQHRPDLRWSGALCLIAASINPYIAAMTLLLCCAAHAQPALLQDREAGHAAVSITILMSLAFLGFVLFGFITSSDISQYVGAGYGLYSMNLFAPFDPGRPGALLLQPQSVRPEQQMEGYNYLGLGVLLLAGVSLLRRPAILRALLRRSSVLALAVFGTCLLLALSTHVQIGRNLLCRCDLPGPIMSVLSSFRASGRLFWPAYYLIFAGTLVAAAAAFRGRWLHAVLGTALAIQVLDLMPMWSFIHRKWEAAAAPAMPSGPAWQQLGGKQRHLVVLPAWQCAARWEDTPGGASGYVVFGTLALREHMTINSFYASRYSAAQRAFFCGDQILDVQRNGLRDDTAYVFPRAKASWVSSLARGTRVCRYADDYILCAADSDPTGPVLPVLQDIVAVEDGETVSFAKGNPVSGSLLGFGWSVPEPWGVWIGGPAAGIVFKALVPPGSGVRIDLTARAFAFSRHPVQRLSMHANGLQVLTAELRGKEPQSLSFVIPAVAIGADRLLRLEFRTPDAVSPALLRISEDMRDLSVGVSQMRVTGIAE
jgi:hypothetical protein